LLAHRIIARGRLYLVQPGSRPARDAGRQRLKRHPRGAGEEVSRPLGPDSASSNLRPPSIFVEHDLFRKKVSTPDQVRGRLYRDHALAHFPDLVQRAQIVGPRRVFVSLRPVGPRHLADIKIAAAVHREAVRRQELRWTETRTKPAEPGNALAGI